MWRSVPKKYATSFWASSFPIDDKSCLRSALYNLLSVPDPVPFSAHGRAITEMGKAAEYQIVYRWGKAGKTIGGAMPLRYGDHIGQLSFEDPDTWLSGSLDAVLDMRPEFDSVLPIDIKSKSDEAIKKMRLNAQNYERKHYAQVQAYIYFCNLYHEEMGWADMGLQPARSGCLFYVSRENPRNTFEYHFAADWSLINKATQTLRECKHHYLSDTLPPRAKEWKWSEEPCKYCNFKKFGCKPDTKENVKQISQSNIIEWASTVRSYSLEDAKEKVLARWT